MIVSRTKVDLLIQKKDLKQKNLLLKIDFIFLTQVKINLLEVSERRHWKRRDRCNAFQINVKRVYFGCY
ncbi:hypothetical protein ACM19_23565 (plasmid) [Escherichia coli]|uniref:Uncharacterized protein n=1 Tax=Salmonella montevideo TaxID=115981 RepID=A0A609D1Q5_SALMO|nr:hypothetical protein [Salmonella enterica]EAC1354251.1 hypothetical protein [Salmonella enterica subsp. enterica serovar Montevideo]EAU9069093.1 hypothetical protein [Salmonella enterica subsp. enterica serovar Cerro]EAW2479042.1 hypothetical protein [Salmonella enterica subsp. enterica]EBJ9925630.1 hypothetical protein [Salmonella enterica subsp. enterica serovar Johannesburg]EBU7841695.1 hypothetical protein [Salmonella enterica subsp. enterica serovar Stanley]EBX0542595.1 hypothetical p